MNATQNGWNLDLFNYYGRELTYGKGIANSKFIARFKYTPRDRKGFQKFLVENFTPAEYFELREKYGFFPLAILQRKGYISLTVKQMLKRGGYTVDQAGLKAMSRDQMVRNANAAGTCTLAMV